MSKASNACRPQQLRRSMRLNANKDNPTRAGKHIDIEQPTQSVPLTSYLYDAIQSESQIPTTKGKKTLNDSQNQSGKRHQIPNTGGTRRSQSRPRSGIPHKPKELSELHTLEFDAKSYQGVEPVGQLLSPTTNQREGTTAVEHQSTKLENRRRVELFSEEVHGKGSRLLSNLVTSKDLIENWLSGLPPSCGFEELPEPGDLNPMSQPPSKRLRSEDSWVYRTSQSDAEFSETRRTKSSGYRDPNYATFMMMEGSHNYDSQQGLVARDIKLCTKLLEATEQVPYDPLFDDLHFARFHQNLRGRSEARIYTDLHTRLIPFVVNLYITGEAKFQGLREGFNDIWTRAEPFYGSRPQPDRTIAFNWSNFTEQQRRKLQIEPNQKSPYKARDDLFFPFLTCEVKGHSQDLEFADNANLNSMSTAIRGTIHLYRRLNRELELHRRILGFSISHDDKHVLLYAHYPEIRDGKSTYWRHLIKEISLRDDNGRNRRIPFYFVVNVCMKFAPPFLEGLKTLIDQIADPLQRLPQLTKSLGYPNILSPQEDFGAYQDDRSEKSHAELETMIQGLRQQLAEQQKQHQEQWKEVMQLFQGQQSNTSRRVNTRSRRRY